ncbi:UPF0538 protein C2orf76 homolog [Hydra vulgaris]|uniref:UPF0538 protein C2orf76 n=1 Tax=Hydra vulgaris TaxID=6087 RepID=T2MC28_HYDVU|nr:UPF0538 protein C2orf76 homolog [Hydra vulgaris]
MEQNGCVVTVRLIRSFEHRNIRNIVYHQVDTSMTCKSFIDFVLKDIALRTDIPPPFRKFEYNKMKIEHQPFGMKSNDPVINRDNDEKLILQDEKSLADMGVINETVLSFFRFDDYKKYSSNPQLVW